MQELISLSTGIKEQRAFAEGLLPFLEEFSLAGIELLPLGDVPPAFFSCIIGVHLPFQPVWLPFWLEDHHYLAQVFPGLENLERFFGGKKPEDFITKVKVWFKKALALRPSYIVIHASHCGLEEVFSLHFRYDSQTVLSAVAELLNLVFEEFSSEALPWILFENLWWPGLRTFSPAEIEFFFKKLAISEKVVGLVLDTSHLLNTSYLLGQPYPIRGPLSPRQAFSLLLTLLEGFPREIRKLIKVVHLNFSPRADLFRPDMEGLKKLWEEKDPLKRYCLARKKVLSLDPHLPFEGVELKKLEEFLEPIFLVHELRFENLATFKDFFQRQRQSL